MQSHASVSSFRMLPRVLLAAIWVCVACSVFSSLLCAYCVPSLHGSHVLGIQMHCPALVLVVQAGRQRREMHRRSSASKGAKLELAIGRPLGLIYRNCTAKFVAPVCSFALWSLFAAGWPSLVRQLLAQDCLGSGRSFQLVWVGD